MIEIGHTDACPAIIARFASLVHDAFIRIIELFEDALDCGLAHGRQALLRNAADTVMLAAMKSSLAWSLFQLREPLTDTTTSSPS
jgi:hypothetical protein